MAGKRGRPPKNASSKARINLGTGRKSGRTGAKPQAEQAANEPEPIPIPSAIPVKPSWLTKEASKLWDEEISDILATRAFHKLDSHLLGKYFQWLAYAIKLEKALKGELLFNHPANNHKIQKPEVSLAIKAWDEVKKAGEACGFTLGSRRKLGIFLQHGEPVSSTREEAKAGNSGPDPQTAWIFGQGPRP